MRFYIRIFHIPLHKTVFVWCFLRLLDGAADGCFEYVQRVKFIIFAFAFALQRLCTVSRLVVVLPKKRQPFEIESTKRLAQVCRLCLVNVHHLSECLTLALDSRSSPPENGKRKQQEEQRKTTKRRRRRLQQWRAISQPCTTAQLVVVRRKINLSLLAQSSRKKLHINLWLWIVLFIVSDFFFICSMHFHALSWARAVGRRATVELSLEIEQQTLEASSELGTNSVDGGIQSIQIIVWGNWMQNWEFHFILGEIYLLSSFQRARALSLNVMQ